jgi:hypothetical protein
MTNCSFITDAPYFATQKTKEMHKNKILIFIGKCLSLMTNGGWHQNQCNLQYITSPSEISGTGGSQNLAREGRFDVGTNI